MNTGIEPRACLERPSDFGKSLSTSWRRGIPHYLLATAEIQHRFSFVVRKAARERFGSVNNYCVSTGQDYQRVGRVLRGQTRMQVDDIGYAVKNLHLSVAFFSEEGMIGGNDQFVLTAASSSARDALGAFYTPNDISSFLVQQLELGSHAKILEPAFGDGSFLSACLINGVSKQGLFGCEIDSAAAAKAIDNGLIWNENVFHGSFFYFPDTIKFDAVVGNPPFVRIRALPHNEATSAATYCTRALGVSIGEESSEWYPFLLKSIIHLREGGGLAFVLPQDFTYLRYPTAAWDLIGNRFSCVKVIRVKERIFKDILQDVILLVATGKGGHTDNVKFICYETVTDLFEGTNPTGGTVKIDDVLSGKRPFQRALIDSDILTTIEESALFTNTSNEALFHIGYVCGSKAFFHPSADTISKYCLPTSSLINTAVSSRQLGSVDYKTSLSDSPSRLWLPGEELTEGERRYIKFGEKSSVDQGYKCRIRKPWWIVPGISKPDAILSVFGDIPKMIINDGGWAISNSLLGAYCRNEILPLSFAGTWYSSVTRLSIELQVHSLGGGVLVAVPQEANRIMKLNSSHYDSAKDNYIIQNISDRNVTAAYTAYDDVIADTYGFDFLSRVKSAADSLAAWRKH